MLYRLANKHVHTYADKSLAAREYKMPTALSGSDSDESLGDDDAKHKKSLRERKEAILNKRYVDDGP